MAAPSQPHRPWGGAALAVSCLIPLLLPACAIAGGGEDSGCSDPGFQLPCYCERIGKPVGDLGDPIAACYPAATQTATFVLFGLFSAWSWSAINWPVSEANGVPDYDQDLRRVRGDNATVWESWKTTGEVFLPDGSAPRAWEDRERLLPASCQAIDATAAKARSRHAGSVPDALPPRLLTDYVNAEGDVVVDRNGELVRFETAMNKPAFDYIVDKRLYNADDQQAFFDGHNRVAFPFATYQGDTRGSYWVKAAWKVLGEKERGDDIHKAWAYLYPVYREGTLVADCELRPVGLLALHVTYKLEQAKQWAWATFEHRRIAPTWDELAQARDDYLLYDPECGDEPDCAAIDAAPALFGHGHTPQRSQLVRQQKYGYGYVCNLPSCAASDVAWINQTFEEQLADTVWASYRLKGTQWVDPSDRGTVKPAILANTVIESYIQGTSTCLGCHQRATTRAPSETGQVVSGQTIPDAPPGDHIFALRKAKPKLSITTTPNR